MTRDLRDQLQSALSPTYTIERELGGGGMSRVFVAEERTLGRRVVVKVLPPEMAEGVSSDRFRREIQVAAGLQHPHIVPLLNAGATDGLLYFTMPFVEGESLRARLTRDGMLSVDESLSVLREIADALAYAHAHGVVHRDIKPDNVLLSNGHALVTDFGIAKAVAASGRGDVETLTVAGTTLGTPSYMAPELIAADGTADHRVDIYAFGCLAYEVLTGSPPFHGLSRQALIAAHFGEVPPAVAGRRPEVPSSLSTIIGWCLEKDPARRPQTAVELIAGLNAIGTPRSSFNVTARRVAKPATLIVAGVSLAVVATAGAWWWVSRGPAPSTSTDVVAVLPFRVSGADPSLAYLREGMVDLLAAKLTGEGGPRAVDPRVAVSAWRRAGGTDRDDVEPQRALALASSVGAGRLMLGTVVGTSRLVTLSVTLQDAPGGRERGRATVEGSPDSLPSLVDALTSRLLVVHAGEEKRLSARITASLPALRSYLDGQRQFRRGNYYAAIRHYQSAIEVDTAFALAGLGKFFACGYDLAGACTGRAGTLVARAGADRLSARDSILLHSLTPRFPNLAPRSEILAAREHAARVLGDSPDAWFSLGDYLMHYSAAFGKLDGAAEAKRAFERAVALDSSFAPALEHLVHLALGEQDAAGVRRFGALYLAQDSVSETAPSIRVQVASVSGDSAAVRRLMPAIDTMPTLSQGILSMFGAVRGGGPAAKRAARALLARQGSPVERLQILQWSFGLMMDGGRPAEALRLVRELRNLEPRSSWVDHKLVWAGLFLGADSSTVASTAVTLARALDAPLDTNAVRRGEQYAAGCVAGAWFASIGEDPRAAKASTLLHRRSMAGDSPSHRVSNDECALMIDAIRAVRGRQPQARVLVASFDSLRRVSPRTALMDEGNLVLARLWEALGERAKAADVAARRTQSPESGYWSEFFLMEGRNAAATGQRERAITAYRNYLLRRADAEPSLRSEVDRVRAELARLERAAR